METKVLEELGLTKNEIEIYLFLLKKGTSTTGPMIKETGIANSRVYESINSLISKGLVRYHLEKEGKHFQATDPKVFIEKQKELKEKIEHLIPELSNLKEQEKDETNLAIYEGFEGFKTAFTKVINDCPKEETIFILGFSEQQYSQESLRTFLINLNLKSAQKKQKLKIILDQSVKNTLGKDRKKERFTEIKYMPKGYISPSAIDIFSDYVYIFLWEKKPYVFMIKNKKIAESFKTYHDLLWQLARP